MLNQLQWLLVITSVFSVVSLHAIAVQAEEVDGAESVVSDPFANPVEVVNEAESAALDSPVILVDTIREAESAAEQPATTVVEWMSRIEAQASPEAASDLAQALIEITAIQVSETANGLELILEAAAPVAEPQTSVVGNALIAEIPNAVLDLPEGEAFEQFAPAEGIALVSMTNLPGDRVQISITGTDAPPQAQISADAGTLVLIVLPGVAQADEAADEAIQIVVTGEAEDEDAYFVPNAPSTLRTDVDIRDTPSSVTVIPQQVIEDQGATNIRDIVRNAAGVNFSDSFSGRNERFTLRGFEAEEFRNGFREGLGTSAPGAELANIERVEVLRGPASVLFGQAEPSGIINFVTKQPLLEPFYELAFTMGSFDFTRPTLDFTGPLTADGSLAYRLNAAYESAGSFRDGVDTERYFIAPTLSWEISDDTELTLEFSYFDDTRPVDAGLVVLSDDEIADIPFDTFLGDPDARLDLEATNTELRLDHRFNDSLSLRSRLRYATYSETGPRVQIVGGSEDDRNFPLLESISDFYRDTFTVQSDLIAEFNTGDIEHTLLFGLEYSNLFLDDSNEQRSGIIDIFNPSDFTLIGELEPGFDAESVTNSLGIYLQNQIAIFDNLQLVVGGRFDTFDTEFTDVPTDEIIAETDGEAFSPRVGIVYRPVEPISLYASYTRSFTPVTGRSSNDELFDPERGTGFEVGVKTEIIPDRLFSTLAFYDTTLSNVLTADLNNPGFAIQTGEVRSQGIELDIQGEILPGWNIFAGYAYTDAEVTEDNLIPVGNRPPNVPEHSFNFWTNYTLQEGDLAGLGFGVGVFYVGKRAGDLANSFFIDGYTRVDAAISYERENYRFGLNLQNLSDAEFIEGGSGRTEITPGAPFTILGTVSVEF